MSYYKIDTKRDWEILLNTRVIDLSEESAKQRVASLSEKDTVILHARDATRWDRDNLLKLESRPKVIVVTGGSSDQLNSNWSSWIREYGAESIFLVPYFADDTSGIQEEERSHYVSIIMVAHPEAEEPKRKGKETSFTITLDEAVIAVRSLATSFRFWHNAFYESLRASKAGRAAGYDRVDTPMIRGVNREALNALLQPTMEGYCWGDLFADPSNLRDVLLAHFKYSGAVTTALSNILGRNSVPEMSQMLASGGQLPTGGAIRFFYDLAVLESGGSRMLTNSKPESESGDTREMLTVSTIVGVLERIDIEISTLETSVDRTSLDLAAKRRAFVVNTLLKAENVRANLYHERLRQNVLQRLIGAEAEANLTIVDESSLEETKFEGWCGLIARADEQESRDGRKWAFEAWSGGTNPTLGVKHTLLQLLADWTSDEEAGTAGLILKSEIAELLRKVESAVEDMDLLIGSDTHWRKHQARSHSERREAAMGFWKNALLVMQCLGRWRNAPLRLLEIYDEI